MQVQLAVLADYALIDRDNKLSVLGIFDQLNPPSLPFLLPRMFWVITIQGEPSESGRAFPLELLIWDPDGSQLFAAEDKFAFAPPPQRGVRVAHNALVGLAGIQFNTAGDHAFIVKINGEERSRITLRVNHPSGQGK